MKKILILVLLLWVGNLFAQQTPEFEFKLCFEDAAGNRDTVILGYDANATDGIDATFGESNILSQPWDTTGLDVRIGDRIYETTPQFGGPAVDYWPITWVKDSNSFLTKKQIVKDYNCSYPDRSDTISIQFTLKNLPITLRWNNNLFEDECTSGSGFYGGQFWASSDMSNGIPSWYGMATIEINRKQGTDTLFVFPPGNPFSWFPIATYMNGIDSIVGIHFIFGSKHTNGLAKNKFNTLSFYPNPVKNVLNIKGFNNPNLKFVYLKLYTLDGRLQKQERITSNIQQLDVSDLTSGMYLLKVVDFNGTLLKTSKLIKQ